MSNENKKTTSDIENELTARKRKFLSELDLIIEFHSTNPNYPYNIRNAVMVALKEVRIAYNEAFNCQEFYEKQK